MRADLIFVSTENIDGKLKTKTGKLNGGKRVTGISMSKEKVEETRFEEKGISNAFFVSLLFRRDINSAQISIARSSRPEVFYKKRCSSNFRKIHKKTPVFESIF